MTSRATRCDYRDCEKRAFREVYYRRKGKNLWARLCRAHFTKERKAKRIEVWCDV